MIKRYILPGLLVWLPILGTFYIIKFMINMMDDVINLVPTQYHPSTLIGFHIPGIGLLVSIVILFMTGVIVTNLVGRKFVTLWEKLVESIPLVRGIHNAVKQVTHAFLQPKNKAFHKVLIVEYPRRGIWSIGFMTSEGVKGVPHEDDLVTVFLPTTPNPTSGMLIIVPRRDLVEVDMTADQALKMIISLGVIMPKNVRDKDAPKKSSTEEMLEAFSEEIEKAEREAEDKKQDQDNKK